MTSVALTGRIHERTPPLSKVLPKSLASPGPSIHEAFDEGILRRLARCDVVPGYAVLIGPCQVNSVPDARDVSVNSGSEHPMSTEALPGVAFPII